MIDLIIFVGLLGLGYASGVVIEKKHFREIAARERAFLDRPAVTISQTTPADEVLSAELVVGSVVVSVDYFKRFLAGLRNLFGGEVKSYSPLLDRARREAILRMKEQAPQASMIVNLRVETSTIGGASGSGGKGLGSVEVIAYGTALVLRP